MTVIQLKDIMNKLNMEDMQYNIVDMYDKSYVEITQEVNGKQIEFIIGFPKGFPYQFPEITVKGKEYKKLPHVDKKSGKICLFKH